MLMQIIEVFHQALCSFITLSKNEPIECQMIQLEFTRKHVKLIDWPPIIAAEVIKKVNQ